MPMGPKCQATIGNQRDCKENNLMRQQISQDTKLSLMGVAFLASCFPGAAQTWQRLTPAASPPPRQGHIAVFDVATSQMLVLGGGTWSYGLGDPGLKNDLSPFSMTTNQWALLFP